MAAHRPCQDGSDATLEALLVHSAGRRRAPPPPIDPRQARARRGALSRARSSAPAGCGLEPAWRASPSDASRRARRCRRSTRHIFDGGSRWAGRPSRHDRDHSADDRQATISKWRYGCAPAVADGCRAGARPRRRPAARAAIRQRNIGQLYRVRRETAHFPGGFGLQTRETSAAPSIISAIYQIFTAMTQRRRREIGQNAAMPRPISPLRSRQIRSIEALHSACARGSAMRRAGDESAGRS